MINNNILCAIKITFYVFRVVEIVARLFLKNPCSWYIKFFMHYFTILWTFFSFLNISVYYNVIKK